MVKKGLGRGLDAILGDPVPGDGQNGPLSREGVRQIPLGDVVPDPDQPRKAFTEESLAELAASLKVHGVIQPILVRPRGEDGRHRLIAGERRWRAAAKAGLHDIPALVRDVDEGQTAELALVENLQRADLNPMEEADAYARMRDVFDRKPQDIADAVGKSRSHVANMLRLTGLPDEVKAHLATGALSMGHARALLSANDPTALAKEVIAKGYSVRQTERRVAEPEGRQTPAAKEGSPTPARPSSGGAKDADTKSLERDLEAALGLSVAIEHSKKGGTVTIAYDTLEQLDDLCRRMMGTAI